MSSQKIIDRDTKRIIKILSEDLSGFYEHYVLDLDAVCKHYGINLMEAEFGEDNISGALTKENDSWHIVVNSKDIPVRRRFTIAHELGHFLAIKYGSEITKAFLEDNEGIIKDYFVVNRSELVREDQYQVERQANMIASTILMPDDKVKSLFERNLGINEMANILNVSESAISFRLRTLGYIPIETMYQ